MPTSILIAASFSGGTETFLIDLIGGLGGGK